MFLLFKYHDKKNSQNLAWKIKSNYFVFEGSLITVLKIIQLLMALRRYSSDVFSPPIPSNLVSFASIQH